MCNQEEEKDTPMLGLYSMTYYELVWDWGFINFRLINVGFFFSCRSVESRHALEKELQNLKEQQETEKVLHTYTYQSKLRLHKIN